MSETTAFALVVSISGGGKDAVELEGVKLVGVEDVEDAVEVKLPEMDAVKFEGGVAVLAGGSGVIDSVLWDLLRPNFGTPIDRPPLDTEGVKPGAEEVVAVDVVVVLLVAIDGVGAAAGALVRAIWMVKSPVSVPVDDGECSFQLKVIT